MRQPSNTNRAPRAPHRALPLRPRFLAAVLLAALPAATLPAAALEVGFEGDEVVVSRATPGSRVGLIGRVWTFQDLARRSTSVAEVLVDGDGDGVVRFTPEVRLDGISVWGAVDVATGATALGVPAGESVLQEVAFPSDGFGPSESEERAQFSIPTEQYVALWVRPEVGAWELRSADGGPRDADGAQDGRATAAASAAEALEEAVSAPAGFVDGDVLVVVDGWTLAITQTRVSGPAGGAR